MSDLTAAIAEAKRPKHDPGTCTRRPCSRCGPHPVSKAPPLDRDQHQHQGPTPSPDPVVRSIGLPSHPEPSAIADVLEEAARTIRARALKAKDMAATLAAKGYSAQTLGDGGSRSSDTTSSTERHAAKTHRWDAADHAYADTLRTIWQDGLAAVAMTNELLRHASDVDETPAGTGECRACARFVRPSKARPSFRLRSGLCPSCFGAWCTYRAEGGPMVWSDWVAHRRESLSERDAAGRLVRVHTPEPEEDGGQGA